MQEGGMPSGMPDGFDPGNMPDQSGGENTPGMSNFNPGSMPDMGGFTPPGSSDSSADVSQSKPDSEMPAGFPSGAGNERPSSFSAMPGQSSQAKTSNLITYGICLAGMITALLIVTRVKRRR
ncbi:MAG: hypothetical protein IJJ44_08250 [Solobacterium sp.]|nr:hypothetical protein [Solobacterium sp.]